MGPVKYSMGCGGISDVTADVTRELDEASGAIDGALTAVDDALGAVSAEGGLAAALRGAAEGRRTTDDGTEPRGSCRGARIEKGTAP